MNFIQKIWLKFSAKARMKQRVKELEYCYIPRLQGIQVIGNKKKVDLNAAVLLLSTVELKYDSEFTKVIEDSEGIAKVRKDWYKTRKGNIVCVSQIYGLDVTSCGIEPIEVMTKEKLREEYNSTRMRIIVWDNMYLLDDEIIEKEEI